MKRIIKKLRFLSALFILLGITKIAYSQTPTYQLYFTNVQHPANNVVVWDAYLLRTGTTPLQLASIQFGFGYDITILNGGTLTASIDAGFSDLPAAMQPAAIQSGTVNYTGAPVPSGQTHRYINIAGRPVPGAGNAPLISNTEGGCGSKGTRIGRFRITNTAPFAPNSRMNQVFSQAVGNNRTRTQINAYVGGINKDITVMTNHFSYNVPGTCDQNIFLNTQLTSCTFTASGTTNPTSCAGTPDGTAEITLQGQWSGLPGTYSVDGGAAMAYSTNPFTIRGLSQGNHEVVVTEGNCITNAVYIYVGSNIAASQTGGTAVSCNSNSDGTAAITLNGAWSGIPGTYKVDGGAANTFSTNPFTITGLSSGNHSVVISADGCYTSPVPVFIENSLVVSLINVTPSNCIINNGTAVVTLSGILSGMPGTYSVDGGAPTAYSTNPFTITGLSQGNHSVVINAGGCNLSPIQVLIKGSFFVSQLGGNGVRCSNNDGKAVITLSGQLPDMPGTYSVNGGEAVPFSTNPITITGLAQGFYSVSITMGLCTVLTEFGIGYNPTLNVTYNKTNSNNCNGNTNNNGTITVFVNGGVAPYTYSINGGTTTQTSNLFTGLGAGDYVIKVVDATGCFATKNASISLSQQYTFHVNPYDVSGCMLNSGSIHMYANGGVQPYTWSIDGINYQSNSSFFGLTQGNYTCYVKDAAGCNMSRTVSINFNPIKFALFTRNSSNCTYDGSIQTFMYPNTGGFYPFSFSLDGTNYLANNLFTGLAPGLYTVYAKDNSGCIETNQVNIGMIPPLVVTALHTNTSACLNDGTIRLQNYSGGQEPFTYSLDGINYQGNSLFTGLAAGDYTFYMKDIKGCTGLTSVTIGQNKIMLNPQVTTAGSCAESNGSIRLFFTGGVGPFTYSLDGITYQAGNLFSGLAAGTYTGYVKDSKGCTGQKDIVVGPVNCSPPVANNAKGIVTSAVTPSVSSLQVHVYPNPGIDEFTLVLSGYNMNEKVSVIVTDIMGRKVYFSEGAGKQQYKFGRSFLAGLYNLQVIQGTNKKSVKLVKE